MTRASWRTGLALLAAAALPSGVAAAQTTPAATQPLALSIFGGVDGTFTGLDKSHNLGITAGSDVEFRARQFFSLQPALELRATYPVHSGEYVGEKNLLGGVRESWVYGRLRPYGEILFGEGRLAYVHGAANPKHTYLYLHSSSFVISPGAGADVRVTERFALKADFQFQRYATPVTTAAHLYAKAFTLGVVYRFDHNHPAVSQAP